MDVALHGLPVTFVLDRAGVTGPDGPSHHGMWDLSLLGTVPGIRVAAPRDAPRLRALLREAVAHPGPTAVRFPKGTPGRDLPACGRLGGADVLARYGAGGVLLLATGPCAEAAVAAAAALAQAGESVTVADPRWLLPVHPALVSVACGFRKVVTVEDHGSAGGFGDAIARTLRAAGARVPVSTMALDQTFLPHGARSTLLADAGLDSAGIRARACTPERFSGTRGAA
jgi:1-deoxy-D-xylulose-5-phosphate synthase